MRSDGIASTEIGTEGDSSANIVASSDQPLTTSKLLELAERCEQATAGDRELDCLIWAELNGVSNITYPTQAQEFSRSGRVEGIDANGKHILLGYIDPGALQRNWSPYGGDDRYPKVTTSLDAALSLVPENWCIMQLSDIAFDGHAGCRLCDTAGPGDVVSFGTFNMTLALTAACLRARASTTPATGRVG